MAFAIPLAPVVTGAVAASSVAGMLLIGSAAIGAVGAITSDKDLQKLGLLVGIGTGIAAAAGVIGTEAAGAATGAVAEGAAAGATEDAIAASPPEKAARAVTGEVGGAGSGLVDIPEVKLTSNFGKDFAKYSAPGNSAAPSVMAGGGSSASDSVLGMISKAFKDNPAMALYAGGTLAQTVGSGLAGALTAGVEEDKLALAREKFGAEQQVAEERQANFNNIGQVGVGLRPIITANLYPNRQPAAYGYRAPAIRAT